MQAPTGLVRHTAASCCPKDVENGPDKHGHNGGETKSLKPGWPTSAIGTELTIQDVRCEVRFGGNPDLTLILLEDRV